MRDAVRKLLVVEDDPGLQSQLRWCFEQYEVVQATTRTEAIAALRKHEPAVVLQDLGLPPEPEGVREGLQTLSEIIALAPHTKVIVVTGNDDRENALRAVAMGAYDFYEKPINTDILGLIVQRAFRMHELEQENQRLIARQSSSPLDGVIAISEGMRRVCRMIEKVAPTLATTLLLGESGTGKELLARAVHALSERRRQPFVAINCAAIPDSLLESELFGYEKGAFTGALKQTPGKLESAHSGTLFLDEIGDMPLALQAKLLRFLQERVIERVGGRETIPVDVRVICATNRDLNASIAAGQFRQDLYFRISEVTVQIPPLREREGDVLVIAQHLLADRARRHGRALRGFSEDAVRALQAYAWPGNIRELENKVNGAVIMAEGKQVSAADLGLSDNDQRSEYLNLRIARQRAETQAIRRALAVAAGNVSKAAELLGITRPTLYDLMEKNDLGTDSGEVAPRGT
ncbi:MAG TPA: PEP-CTERM-box response regulator transcription factor [Steroidobacteraceae bacterium]|jgi:two-component system NtrC family response regulator|nr:PEP-CTERM-box response regulator transcription factor [Steroidobacteraceae bacterium]